MINHYRTLGVDPQAETVVIRGAYLALIRRYHPDKGGEEADPERAQAVTAAWEVLRDPERRAAYDETRLARFQPDEGSGAAIIRRAPRVRGGAAGRNLFLLLAAGTVGLGWWALQQPQLQPPVKGAATAASPPPPPTEPAIRPAEDEHAARLRIAAEEQPRLPDVGREPEVETPVVLPPLPVPEQARMPVRTAGMQVRDRPPGAAERVQSTAAPKVRVQEQPAAAIAAAAPGPPRIDLAPLERHLQLLTDQSLRYGTEAKRSRLFATRNAFLKRLRDCASDACKRDAYLRRNAEVGEIMGN